jgi:hypothetical protein
MKKLTFGGVLFAALVMTALFVILMTFSSCGSSSISETSSTDSTMVQVDSTLSVSDSTTIKVDTASHVTDTANH